MNSFKLFGLKRKLAILFRDEDFFKLHSREYGSKKRQKQGAKEQFCSQLKNLNAFFIFLRAYNSYYVK